MSSKSDATTELLAFVDDDARSAPETEPFADRWRRRMLGSAWSIKHQGLGSVPGVAGVVASHYLKSPANRRVLPNPDEALSSPDGLAGVCNDLSVETLLAAYRSGLYPFCHVEPMKWWAPSERMVLFIEDFRMEKNLRRRLRNKHFSVTFDQNFEEVVRACGEARPGRRHLTWITPRVVSAFNALHEAGHAHSVEVRDKDGNLAGGCYGIGIGRVFFTESQFVRVRDASKVGFATLNRHLQSWGYVLNDGKQPTGHLTHVGFNLIPRREFNDILAKQCALEGKNGRWFVDEDLDVGSWDPRATCVESDAQ